MEREERATATFGKGKKAQPAIAEKGGKESKEGKGRHFKFKFGWLEMASVAPEPPRLEVDQSEMALLPNFFKERPFVPIWKRHNAALKYFRAHCESEDLPLYRFSSAGGQMAVINHAKKEMNFSFSETETTTWCWMDMLSQLGDDSLHIVCNGHQNRSGGVVRCLLMPRPNSYDHKRHHAAKANGEPVTDRRFPVWDFVIAREDGTAIRLHPQWTTTKIEAFPAQGYLEQVEHPAKGKGQSLGPGTYAWFKETIGTAETLRFDAQFRRPRQPQRGGGP